MNESVIFIPFAQDRILFNDAEFHLRASKLFGTCERIVHQNIAYAAMPFIRQDAKAAQFTLTNELISAELKEISQHLRLNLITPTAYVF